MGIFSAIASVASSVIGSVIGGKKDKGPQETTSHVDYKRMVKDATEAGFNPLTALRNGGAAGFANTSTSHPALSSSDAFFGTAADALQAGVNAFANYDPMQEKRQALEYDLVQAQLDNIQSSTAINRRMMEIPAYSGASRISTSRTATGRPGVTGTRTGAPTASRTATSTTASGVTGAPVAFESEPAKVTNPWTFMDVNPSVADGSAYEDRYGEYLGGVLGIIPGIVDTGSGIASGLTSGAVKLDKGFRDMKRKQPAPKEQRDIIRERLFGGW